MTVPLVVLVRTFPRLSETFIAREASELVRRGEPVTVWSLLPPEPGQPDVAPAADALPHRRSVPAGPRGALRLAAATAAAFVRRPRRAAGALRWAATWSLRERDPRHLLAFAYAAYLDRRLPARAHVHAHFANTPATTAAIVARLGGRTWSFTGHARDLWAVTSPAFLAEKARSAAFVAVETEHGAALVRDAVRRHGGAADVLIVRNGLELGPPPPRRPEPGLIVATGRLVPKKGFPTLLDALALLRERGADARLELLGGGPLEAELRAQARRLGLEGAVVFRGAQPLGEVRAALLRASAFALPCRVAGRGDSDNLPLAILEALELGVPVVTTPVAGIPEAVRDGESGLLVAPDDPAALAAALERLLGDPALCERLAAGGRATIEREFDLRGNVAVLAERCRLAAAA